MYLKQKKHKNDRFVAILVRFFTKASICDKLDLSQYSGLLVQRVVHVSVLSYRSGSEIAGYFLTRTCSEELINRQSCSRDQTVIMFFLFNNDETCIVNYL